MNVNRNPLVIKTSRAIKASRRAVASMRYSTIPVLLLWARMRLPTLSLNLRELPMIE